MRYSLIILMVILGFSCSNKKIPKGILTDKEITPILVELHLAEAVYTQRYALEITRENYQEDLYLTILKKYKLDQKAFEASVLYYGKHPDKYKPIYDEILNRLNEMEVKGRAKDSIQAIKVTEKARDSIQIIAKDSVQIIPKDTVQPNRKEVKPAVKDTAQIIK